MEHDLINVNKTYLVVLALHALGGESDLESIAVKAHELFSEQFCWRSYPQFPDKDAVRVHLSEAKKSNFGKLVVDLDLRTAQRGNRGYTKRFALTKAGHDKATELRQRLAGVLAGNASVNATRNSLDHKRLTAPVLASDAFDQFKAGRPMRQIGKDLFLQAFKLFPDASRFVATGRITRVAVTVAALPEGPERQMIEHFIQEGRDAFGY